MVGFNDILKTFNGECEKSYQEKGFCHSYFFEHFNVYPSELHIKQSDYLKTIKNFHDPILTYVALYLYHNYGIAQQYFKPKGENNFINKSYGLDSYNTACAVLNRWLDQQKNFYTHFGTCFHNLRWWNISIEPLWKELEKYYPDKTCERYDSYYYKDVPPKEPKVIDDKCYQQQPEENVCFKKNDSDKNSIKENCAKLSILYYLGEKYKLLDENSCGTGTSNNVNCNTSGNIHYTSMLKSENLCFCDTLISSIALPISVTVLGTIFLVFFLNEVIKTCYHIYSEILKN